MTDIGDRFRQVSNYALTQGFVGGFPNFHQADYGKGLVYGTVFLRSGFATWRDVPATTLGNPPGGDVGARFRATQSYANNNGIVGGFPNFHQADYGHGLVYGTFLLGNNAAEWRDVPATALGNPPGGDVEARFRATNDYAARTGFAAGFPNFHQADYGHGLVYGTILLRRAAVEWRDVPAIVLNPPPPADPHCARVYTENLGGGYSLAYHSTHNSYQEADAVRAFYEDYFQRQGFRTRSEVTPGPC
jgi:hypothetical protein